MRSRVRREIRESLATGFLSVSRNQPRALLVSSGKRARGHRVCGWSARRVERSREPNPHKSKEIVHEGDRSTPWLQRALLATTFVLVAIAGGAPAADAAGLAPPPTQLRATGATTSSVSLEWTGNLLASSYGVYRNGALVGSTTATTYTVTGLAVRHVVRVRRRRRRHPRRSLDAGHALRVDGGVRTAASTPPPPPPPASAPSAAASTTSASAPAERVVHGREHVGVRRRDDADLHRHAVRVRPAARELWAAAAQGRAQLHLRPPLRR